MTTAEATAEEVFTLSEAADYLNVSIGYFNAERKQELATRGATLGGRGQGSSIPKNLLDELKEEGWGSSTRRTRSVSVSNLSEEDIDKHPDVVKAVEAHETATNALRQAEAEVVRWKGEMKEASKHITAVRRDVAKELARKAKKPTAAERRIAELQAEAEKLERQRKRVEDRLAKAKAKAEATED